MGVSLAVTLALAQHRGENSGLPTSSIQSNEQACAKCHKSIYNSYRQTPMARSSGLAMENFIPADFTHPSSGVHYRIYADSGRAWLSFDREGTNPLHGKRELLYYIGSGRRGLTYLFSDEGYVFESPINWYGVKRIWDMTPAYQNANEMPLNLPAHTRCLHCHVSGMRPPINGSENHYEMPLLTQSGVSCKRCHGASDAHIRGGPIINPAKLSAERRDAICMQCHMEGRVLVERARKHIYEFRPGDLLSDYVRYYVLGDSALSLGAVTQVEALAQSMCKKKTGDSMSCTSCHDPHYSPPADERAAYFRGKCLACHGTEFGAKHHPENRACTTCHMPAAASTNIAHTEVTDHRIPRLVDSMSREHEDAPVAQKQRLVPFPDSPQAENDLRDLALAWESMADTGAQDAKPQARELLRRSASMNPNDAPTLAALAYEEQTHGDIQTARLSYRRALALDPNLIDAATNFGVMEAQAGDLPAAVDLLRGALDRAPGNSAAGMNLARVLCLAGKVDDARTITSRVLEFNPDMNTAKRFLRNLQGPSPNCNAN